MELFEGGRLSGFAEDPEVAWSGLRRRRGHCSKSCRAVAESSECKSMTRFSREQVNKGGEEEGQSGWLSRDRCSALQLYQAGVRGSQRAKERRVERDGTQAAARRSLGRVKFLGRNLQLFLFHTSTHAEHAAHPVQEPRQGNFPHRRRHPRTPRRTRTDPARPGAPQRSRDRSPSPPLLGAPPRRARQLTTACLYFAPERMELSPRSGPEPKLAPGRHPRTHGELQSLDPGPRHSS